MDIKKSKSSLVLTFLIKIFFLIALFFGTPYFFVSVVNKYQQKASGLIDEESAVIQVQAENNKQMKVLTQAEANTLAQIGDFIAGTWVSEYDGRYKIQIDSNNKFEEYYDDVKEGYGVWRVFSGAKDEVNLSSSPEIVDNATNNSTANDVVQTNSEQATSATNSAYTKSQFDNPSVEDTKYFFQKQQFEPGHKGEKYVYQIQQLDTEKFILVYKEGTGKPLVFVRVYATSTINFI